MLMLITCSPSVSVMRSVLNTPAGVLHMTLLSDIQSVDSVDVCPTTTNAVYPYAPSPEPITTIVSPPGSITFDVPSTDTAPVSADTIPVTDPAITPDVTDTRLVPEIECEGKHMTAVSDIHSDLSHPVCPTLATSDIEYRLHPSPATVTPTPPPPPTLARPATLTPTLSTVNTSDWLPTRCPAVTDTRRVPPP
jgi:hypothetical protein